MQTLNLLWSINERLSGHAGLDLVQPDQKWIGDLVMLAQRETERAAAKKLERIEQDEEEIFYGRRTASP